MGEGKSGCCARVLTDSTFKQPTLRRPCSLRRRVRRLPLSSPSKREGMEHRAAHQSFRLAAPLSPGTRAPLGAPWRRRYGAGPRFRRPNRPAFGPQARPLLGSRTLKPRAGRQARPSASSSRQVVMPAGGAPAPPGRCVHPRPRAPHLLPPARRLMRAPSSGGDELNIILYRNKCQGVSHRPRSRVYPRSALRCAQVGYSRLAMFETRLRRSSP